MYQAPSIGLVVALVGVTIIVVRGSIFGWLRRAGARALFGCALCVGFWVGAICVLVERPSLSSVPAAILEGATVGLCSLLVDALLVRLLGAPAS